MAEAAAEAERHGYAVGSSVTKATTILVCGEKVGAKKIADAEKQGVTVLTEAQWKEKLQAAGGDGDDDDVVDGEEEEADEEDEEEEEEEEGGAGGGGGKAIEVKMEDETTQAPSSDDTVVVLMGSLTGDALKEATAKAGALGLTAVLATKAIIVHGDSVAVSSGNSGIEVLTASQWLQSKATAKETKRDDNAAISRKDDVVVFTGTLTRQTRSAATAEAERHGYTVGSTITKATSILVCGEKVGKKKEDAEKKGIKIYTEDEWADMLSTESSVKAPTAEPAAKPATKRKARSAADEATSSEPEIVVFTGTLVKHSRKQATAEAEAKGFRVDPRVTKATTFVVCGDRAGQKRDEALKLGILVFTEDEWEAKLAAIGGGEDDGQRPKKKQFVPPSNANTDTTMADVEPEYDPDTGAIGGIKPKVLIDDGTFREVKSSSSSSTYLIKRLGSTYSCNCPAWRNQRHAPTARTCKHLREVLGEEFEKVRATASATAPRGNVGTSGSRAATKSSAPKLLLAKKWEREKNDPVGWWMSEKLDGVRAFWHAEKQVFLSRLGNVFPAPEWFTKCLPKDQDLDGELFGGRGRFQFTVGIAKTENSKHWDQLVYKIFDVPSMKTEPFEERMSRAKQIVEDMNVDHVQWVDHTKCESLEQLDEAFNEIEKLGGEGMMIREPGSRYVGDRSSSLLKIKSFHDGEALVIAHEDGKGKYVGMCGALRCKMASGKMFKVASGLSDEQRANPPAIGSIVVYKCQELTDDGIPRFPVFVGVAADKDSPTDPIISNAVGREE
ncbi:hypothetical protein P43SY_003600 [Pythium insidiosum]|uniref:SWIM-type domain-containing protein n=1 Tax=Pythium insidiosum TaxID=114742 RepID=A0AAD5LTL7_PYTIN|nr:hypothetical protein P43SY_003600 [Pythium insidiosum]